MRNGLTALLVVVSFFSVRAQESGQYFASFDGTKIYYEVKGAGYPVVLVHGFIVDGESWKRGELYNDLQTAGYQVITLDQRGNGKSDKPHIDEAYEKDAEARDIMKLADLLNLKNYKAVGYSRGAIIVSRLLLLDSRVESVVMGGMGLDFTNPEWPRRILFAKALGGENVPELEDMVKRVKDSGLDQQALALLQKFQPFTSKEDFAKMTKPVLVICGDQDEDNGSSKDLAGIIPRSSYVRVPGNHGNASRSKEFSTEVLSFLKRKS